MDATLLAKPYEEVVSLGEYKKSPRFQHDSSIGLTNMTGSYGRRDI